MINGSPKCTGPSASISYSVSSCSLASVALWCCCFAFASQLQAAEWRFVKGVETEIVYTDQESKPDTTDDDITETDTSVTPFILMTGSGRHSTFTVNARVIANKSSVSGESEIRPSLAATSSTYSSSKRLRFDTSALLDQRTVNSAFLDDDTLLPSSSRERVVTLSAGPRYKKRFGATRIGTSYTVGAATSSETADSGSIVQAAAFESKTALTIPHFGVGTRINAQHTAFDAAPSAASGSFSVFADYRFRRNLSGVILLGQDLIDVDDEALETHSTIWGLGVVWRPRKRLSVEGAYSERIFGRQPRLAISLDGRRSSVKLDWTRQLNISAASEISVLALDEETIDSDTGADSVTGEANVDDTNSPMLPLFQESRNINEKVTASYTLNGRVSVFTVAVSRINQENLSGDDTSVSTLISASLSRKFSRSSTVVLSLATGKTSEDTEDTNVDFEDSINRMGLRWKLLF